MSRLGWELSPLSVFFASLLCVCICTLINLCNLFKVSQLLLLQFQWDSLKQKATEHQASKHAFQWIYHHEHPLWLLLLGDLTSKVLCLCINFSLCVLHVYFTVLILLMHTLYPCSILDVRNVQCSFLNLNSSDQLCCQSVSSYLSLEAAGSLWKEGFSMPLLDLLQL